MTPRSHNVLVSFFGTLTAIFGLNRIMKSSFRTIIRITHEKQNKYANLTKLKIPSTPASGVSKRERAVDTVCQKASWLFTCAVSKHAGHSKYLPRSSSPDRSNLSSPFRNTNHGSVSREAFIRLLTYVSARFSVAHPRPGTGPLHPRSASRGHRGRRLPLTPSPGAPPRRLRFFCLDF